MPSLPLMTSAGLEARRTRVQAPVHDHALGDAGRLVHRLRHGLAFDEILEADDALDLGEDRTGVGIPFRDALAALDLSPSSTLRRAPYCTRCTARSVPSGPQMTTATLRAMTMRSPSELRATMAVAQLHDAVEIGLDEGAVRDLRRAADVEGAHGELGARLADRLRRDDADRLAHVDGRAARQIAAVAGRAARRSWPRRSAPSGSSLPGCRPR